jgi:hypothetical protein
MGRTYLAGQSRQDRTGRTGQAGHDRQDRTGRTGQAGQGMEEQRRWDRTSGVNAGPGKV